MNNGVNYKKCKRCGAQIPFKAKKCQFCGKTVKIDTFVIVIFAVVAWFIFVLGGLFIIGSETDNISEESTVSNTEITPIEQLETTTIKQTEPEEVLQTEIITSVDDLTEMEYKANCKELYYDDIFFGDDNLEGKYVKIHLLLSEKYYFTADNMYSDTFKQYNDKYNLNRDFFKACVLRETENSYVGNSINVWFSDNYDIDVANYQTGDKIIVYAEVISWSNNTWNGFNSVTILPKYIEEE